MSGQGPGRQSAGAGRGSGQQPAPVSPLMIPLLVVVFYLPFKWTNFASAAIFGVAAITDWLDGWIARRYHQSSAFGAFLDPVADKFLVCASLLILVQMGRVNALIALVIIGREIAISALREWMAELGQRARVKVATVGKIKTVVQMVAIGCLLYAIVPAKPPQPVP